MAWTTPRTWTTGEVVTKSIMDTHVRDNFNVTAPAVLTATGDILYASSANAPARLAKGAANTVLTMGGSCVPAWSASPSVTDLTIGGGCITLTGAATDIDLIDNNACALSFDASGQAGILAIDTQNCAEGVKMNGKLTVGVDDTGYDVKFFGAAAGAYMEWDESANLLEVRGATAAGPGHLKLTTGETTVVACDVLGKIEFQAPAEADCSADARLIAASIAAVAQGTFSNTVNATDLIFYTGHSETAAEKIRFTSQGEIGIGGANYGNDGQVLTSGGAGAAVAWEDASGGLDSCADAIIHNGYGIVIGHTAALAAGDHPANTVGEFTMIGSAGGDTGVHIIRHSSDAGGGAIRFAKSRNATVGSHTVVQACDTLGEISWFGCDGGDLQPFAARIRVHVDGTPGTNDMPGRIDFSTTADGGCDPTLAMRINKSQQVLPQASVYIKETANGNMGLGLTINQDGYDNEIFALKSSDVAHGVTCRAETDTYGYIAKTGGANGGLGITGLTEYSGYGIVLSGITCGDNTTKGTGGFGQVMVQALKKSGSTTASAGSDANLFVIQAGGSTARFIFDAEGTAHADVGTATYDDYCDVELLRGMLATTCDQYRQNYMDRFGTDLMYNQQWYEDNKIIGKDSIHYETRECGRVQQRAMINFTGLTMLHHSTIIQLADRLNDRIDGIETQLQALSEGK